MNPQPDEWIKKLPDGPLVSCLADQFAFIVKDFQFVVRFPAHLIERPSPTVENNQRALVLLLGWGTDRAGGTYRCLCTLFPLVP
jgi:hypothetical protein